ncbi:MULTISPECIES: type II toxin-antitoxin system Phd/YefM family antitoxin [unclassified Wenzhouxiangella]|uniref:type II toxin-antitoxin system Phd/YefM family antitoxin n=1 Tax=unclassified Wenzhouxiangella TaxID=2613841 RepID=UPI000E32CCB1|nr:MULTISPECIES: type II toxin-antitoxin system Phd/YefM family antitoxin [unclassified Wenzhouxiangella]RFF26766.1 type II toxin-antitoxin system Phd/YefM family antitoxin [Wenzhouxiangella sp. 15181]RFP67730.1 type II toxin-antitoxin system Phd/YefM family antitoxin [Wenzhouxiangella sp. 15190]
MENTITAEEIKRRGISAVDEALKYGPVHVIQRSKRRYVILSEENYQSLARHSQARSAIWSHVTSGTSEQSRSKADIDQQIQKERRAWDT